MASQRPCDSGLKSIPFLFRSASKHDVISFQKFPILFNKEYTMIAVKFA